MLCMKGKKFIEAACLVFTLHYSTPWTWVIVPYLAYQGHCQKQVGEEQQVDYVFSTVLGIFHFSSP